MEVIGGLRALRLYNKDVTALSHFESIKLPRRLFYSTIQYLSQPEIPNHLSAPFETIQPRLEAA